MDLNGVVGHVVQGTNVLLQCTVRAARPAANITWQNGTEYLNESNDRLKLFNTTVHENVSTVLEIGPFCKINGARSMPDVLV